MAKVKFFLPLFLLLSLAKSPLSAQSQTEPQTWVIVSYIKESAKVDYEKWMTDLFFAPMKTTQDPVLKQQFSTARWLKPIQQNEDKTWTYCILLDPVMPNGNYDIAHHLDKTYGVEKGKIYMQQYEGFMASAGQIHFFK